MSALAVLFAATCVLTNAADVTLAVHKSDKGTPFDLRGMISPYVPNHSCFLITDSSGSTRIEYKGSANTEQLQNGDIIRAVGTIDPYPSGMGIAICSQFAVETHRIPPPVAEVSIAEIKSGKYDNLPVKVQGTIKEVFRDDIDPLWYYMILTDGDKSIYMTLHSDCADLDAVQRITGAFVAVTGLCAPWDYGFRVTLGRFINLLDFNGIEIIRPAPPDPFDVPEVVTIRFPNPEDIPPLERRRLSGKVIAVWHGNRMLIKSENGDVHTVELSGSSVPEYGATIEAVGLVRTDLYRMNLSDAIWRYADLAAIKEDAAEDVRGFLRDENGSERIIPTLHGRTFRLHGTVQDRPSSDTQYALVTLKCDTETIPIDVSANRSVLDDISIDSVIEVTGTCIVECDNWHSYSAFPHVTGITLVIRTPSDIRILKRPPWWTPRRLAVVIGGLLALLLGVVVRNMAQRRNAARMAKFATDLKVEERTRLAVELHDSLAQNLTGVSLEIDTAGKLVEIDPKAMREHLGQATRTLKSCRDELRNCIWDLRNRALEEASMDEAIRQTLAPHVVGVEVAIRFNVPRERISDNTTHAILRSIRELTINAVRHGKATKIWIAGSIYGDNLLFSVRDNGTGFDPATAPGFAEGHYGLVGITERVESLEGEFNIESSRGNGTKAIVKIKLKEPQSSGPRPRSPKT